MNKLTDLGWSIILILVAAGTFEIGNSYGRKHFPISSDGMYLRLDAAESASYAQCLFDKHNATKEECAYEGLLARESLGRKILSEGYVLGNELRTIIQDSILNRK